MVRENHECLLQLLIQTTIPMLSNPANAMTNEPSPSAPLKPDLATFLFARREAILNEWRTNCERDSSLQTVSALSREEFNDMVPTLLNILGQRLRGERIDLDPVQTANEHGLHRWQKGYALRELLQEIGHLFSGISDELGAYAKLYPDANALLLMQAHREVMGLYEDTIVGSAARYDELERTAAASRASTLQLALDQLNELVRQRYDMLRTSSHDLRSSVGLVQGAAFMLDLDTISAEDRSRLMDTLNRNLANLEKMLQSLMSLARLEAGQDVAEVSEFDVAKLVRELAESTQPLADQQELTLLTSGPEQLIVESDSGKVHRIVQNLLVNALTYTASGVVSVSWAIEDDHRWMVSVQDTGPGLPDNGLGTLVGALRPTQDSTSVFDSRVPAEEPISDAPGPPRKPNAIRPNGEGVGLHIVKRLCELLEASIDIETGPGKGTLIRIRFPRFFRR